MSDLVGTTISPYQITERLGRGGMADVYKAFHRELSIHRAIKFIRPEFVTSDDFRARFQQQGQVVARQALGPTGDVTMRHSILSFGMAGAAIVGAVMTAPPFAAAAFRNDPRFIGVCPLFESRAVQNSCDDQRVRGATIAARTVPGNGSNPGCSMSARYIVLSECTRGLNRFDGAVTRCSHDLSQQQTISRSA